MSHFCKFSIYFFLLFPFTRSFSQSFTWVKSGGLYGVYGVKGVAAPANHPGARAAATCWTDASGNLWLFGGSGGNANTTISTLNDLWKYDPAINQWTWMSGDSVGYHYSVVGTQGVPSPLNKPGNRLSCASWADANGNLWLFGGFGIGTAFTTYQNDFWKYTIASNQWTWISGVSQSTSSVHSGSVTVQGVPSTTNIPDQRYQPTTWVDASGNFWLYGGWSYGIYGAGGNATNAYDDLWKYNPALNEWTWVKGGAAYNEPASFGPLGVATPTAHPGARVLGLTWVDNNFLWMASGAAYLNDLWKYNIQTNEWTWVHGSDVVDLNHAGAYGTLGISSPTNYPAGRYALAGWTDNQHNFWLYGGGQHLWVSGQNISVINDVWRYDLATNIWLWTKKGIQLTQPGQYGVQGTPSLLNIPPSAMDQTAYWSRSGEGWYLDGDANLWRFDNCFGVKATAAQTLVCSGEPIQLIGLGATTYTWFNGSNTAITTITAFNNFEYPVTRIYTVSGDLTSGCQASSAVAIKVAPCTALENSGQENRSFSVFPVPSHDKLYFNMPVETAVAQIFSVYGSLVLQLEIKDQSYIETAALPAGIYIASITNKEEKKVFRFIKE